MRILRMFFIGMFVAAAAAFGLLVTLIAGAVGAMMMAVKRWTGHAAAPHASAPGAGPTRAARRRPMSQPADVIDVSATEVPLSGKASPGSPAPSAH